MPQPSRYSLRNIKFNSSFLINTPINICTHITNITYFKFDNAFYKQKSGLSMGNPLSSVLDYFGNIWNPALLKYRLSINATYSRYIDDIPIYLPQRIKIEKIAEKLNNVEPRINFTNEKESNNTTPFLNILIIKSKNNLNFKFYQKSTNKNDYKYFYKYKYFF